MAVGEEFDAIRRYWSTPEGQKQLVSSTVEGLARVRDKDSDYIFLMEGLSAKYFANKRPCDLVTVGEQFGTRSFGFAVSTRLSASWSEALQKAMMELAESGDVEVRETPL